MRVIGKIGWLEASYQQEKTSEKDGHKYWGEKYNIFFESGDDVHMVETDFIHCQEKDGGRERLRKQGIFEGAIGEMTIHYTFSDWQGKKYRRVELREFKCMNMPTEPKSPESTKPAEVAAEFAQAAEQAPAPAETAQEASTEGTNLPF